jgi:hypothetical protein
MTTTERYTRAIEAVRAHVFPSRMWSLRPPASAETVDALYQLETRWPAADETERGYLAYAAEALAAELAPRRLLARRDTAAIRKRFGDALNALLAILATASPLTVGGMQTKTSFYTEAQKHVEAFKEAKTDTEELAATRQMEALLARAREEYGTGGGLTAALSWDWRKWALVAGGVVGGIALLRMLTR